jgi:hypothetical protein
MAAASTTFSMPRVGQMRVRRIRLAETTFATVSAHDVIPLSVVVLDCRELQYEHVGRICAWDAAASSACIWKQLPAGPSTDVDL